MWATHEHRGTVRTPPRSQGVHHTGSLQCTRVCFSVYVLLAYYISLSVRTFSLLGERERGLPGGRLSEVRCLFRV